LRARANVKNSLAPVCCCLHGSKIVLQRIDPLLRYGSIRVMQATVGPIVEDFVVRVFLPLVLVILASFLAVRLAFGRFKNETLWTRKLDAYTKILEALHYSRVEAAKRYEEELKFMEEDATAPTYTPEYKAHLAEMKLIKLKADAEMQRILDTGTLIVSAEATKFLAEALKPRYEDWKNDPGFEFWETEEKNMRAAIDRITEIARKDLRV